MRQRVIIRHCDEYDTKRIATILSKGMAALDVWPHGRVLVKPNLVTPHPRFLAHHYTIHKIARAVRGTTWAVRNSQVG